MQFCTLNEAWGNKECFTDNNVTNSTNVTNKKNENITETESDIMQKEPLISHNKYTYKKPQKKIYYSATEESLFDNYTDTINDKHERDKLLQKVLKSRRCRDVLRKKFRPDLINKLILILDDYRDVIVLLLVGFCIVIFLNMLYNINKKN
jgi:hypothetical protein